MYVDNNLWIAKIYAENIRHQADMIRARTVDAANLLKDSATRYEAAFGQCATVQYETMAEEELKQAEANLRHAADVVLSILNRITEKRSISLILEAAE